MIVLKSNNNSSVFHHQHSKCFLTLTQRCANAITSSLTIQDTKETKEDERLSKNNPNRGGIVRNLIDAHGGGTNAYGITAAIAGDSNNYVFVFAAFGL